MQVPPRERLTERHLNRQWPWVQSGFLTLHSLVMIMKMHSYISVNGYLHDTAQRSQRALAHLCSLTQDPPVGGLNKAILDAKAHLESDSSEAYSETEPDGTVVSTKSSISEFQSAAALRRRMVIASKGGMVELGAPIVEAATPGSSSPSTPDGSAIDSLGPSSVSILVHHPSQAVAAAALEFLELDAELVSTGTERVRFPQNLTWKNFCIYMLIPTLVYELEYPRTDR